MKKPAGKGGRVRTFFASMIFRKHSARAQGSRFRSAFITFALCLVVFELFFAGVYWHETRQIIWARSVNQEPGIGSTLPTRMMLNPYLGYTFRPGFTFADANWRYLGYDSAPDFLSW